MRRQIVTVASFLLCASLILSAAQRGQRGASSPAHDPHDLSGVWLGRAITTGLNNPGPVYTPAGKAAEDKNKPSFGPRAVVPALGNDPLGDANPPGIPRLLINHPVKFQFIPLQDKVIQLLSWYKVWREIWTDGRKPPEDPDPTWYGYSTAKWQGDEFVITTTGLDPRAWADCIGTPKSEDAVVEERYRRLDRDNLQLTVTVTDPKYYVKPIGAKFAYRMDPEQSLFEDIFAPVDEESFNKRVRNPAGGVNR
jgi:hypothetical protein